MARFVEEGGDGAGEAIRRLSPWIPPEGTEAFSRLAARWALSEGKAPLALRLAPSDPEIVEGASRALRSRLLFSAWERAKALGLPSAPGLRARLMEDPGLSPSMEALLEGPAP